MKEKIKNEDFIINAIFVFVIVIFVNINLATKASALSSIDCSNLEGENKDKCEDVKEEDEKFAQKAATYEKMLLLKQKQKTMLGTQIAGLNTEIEGLKGEIDENSNKIDELNNNINELQSDISKNEVLIQSQKKILASIIRLYHENNDNAITKIIFNIENFSAMTSKSDHLSQAGDKITEITENLKNFQSQIKDSQEEIIKKRTELVDVRFDLEEKNADLSSTKSQKNTLLIQTKGDEASYQQKLQKIEKQKQELLGDIDELYNANYAEISAFALGLERPTSGLAETSWYYSQRDPRWGNETIGNSKSKMKDLGCAVSSVAMVFTYHGEHINPKQLSDKPIFSWDLINWPSSWDSLRLASSTSHGGVNWSTIDKELTAKNPVIIFINARGGAGHYVVIHHKATNGKYVVHDPYWGANIYLDSSIELLSKLYGVSISKKAINQVIIYK